MLARLLLAAVVAAVGSPHGIRVHVERVAGHEVDFEVTFPYGGGPDRFVGYTDDGRPTWLTTCFLREFYAGRLCGKAPPGPLGPAPDWILPARFAHPALPGLISPGPLAFEPDGSLLIVDKRRDELYRRAPDGSLHAVMPTTTDAIAVAPDGSIYLADGERVEVRAPDGSIHMLRHRFVDHVQSLAVSPTGALLVGTWRAVVDATGKLLFRPTGKYRRSFGGDLVAAGAHGAIFAFSFGSKTLFEATAHGRLLHVWATYADALATAPDGSVVVGTHFATLQRVRNGKLTTVAGFGKGEELGFPFQPDGVAVAKNGTIYADTDVGNGFTNQTALAAVTGGRARLVRSAAPSFSPVTCPSLTGLRPFDAAARKTAISTAETVDTSFPRGLSLTDPSWWSGYYTDQIDGRYDWGRHRVHSVGSASADPYSSAVAERCGAALVRDSLAIVVGRGVYSGQISHMFFLDRNGRALLYWQHT